MAYAITSTYCGEDAGVWIQKALLGGDTLAANCLTLVPNIKFQAPVNRLQIDDLLQGDSCNFSASGNVTIDERLITPAAHKVNVELCVTDLESHWIAANMQPGAMNADAPAPAPLGEFIIDYVAAKVAEQVDALIWNASVGGGDQFDGVITKLVAAGGFLAPAVPSAVTAGNVIAKLQEMYDLIPDAICMAEDLKFYVSKKIAKLYKQAVATQSAEKYFVGDVELNFLGLPIVPLRGMEADDMLITTVSNLFFGTDLMADMNEVKVIDMRETTGDDTARLKMRFKIDVQFAFADQVVLHNV